MKRAASGPKPDIQHKRLVASLLAGVYVTLGGTMLSVFAGNGQWLMGWEGFVLFAALAPLPVIGLLKTNRTMQRRYRLACAAVSAIMAVLLFAFPVRTALASNSGESPQIRIDSAPAIAPGRNGEGELVGHATGLRPGIVYRVAVYAEVKNSGYMLQPTTLKKNYLVHLAADGTYRTPTHGADVYYALLIVGEPDLQPQSEALPSDSFVIARAQYKVAASADHP
ncbi:MAG TPA: hypothetical protein VHE55_15240 [Fimbriimonadaceae bacterium]|nr:hypothetical protein [Fimbriimonadaceae bacterium]